LDHFCITQLSLSSLPFLPQGPSFLSPSHPFDLTHFYLVLTASLLKLSNQLQIIPSRFYYPKNLLEVLNVYLKVISILYPSFQVLLFDEMSRLLTEHFLP